MTRALVRIAAACCAACACAGAVMLAQAPQAPAYKGGVDLIAVDVSVVDRTGQPVRSLQAEQFDVTVDGKPRRVLSAEIVDHAAAGGTAAQAGAKAPERTLPAYSTNETSARTSTPGRLFFIVVDQASFRPAGARGATEAARRFIDRLQPTDRVGLLAFPPPGPAIAASPNHQAVRAALNTIVGTAQPPRMLGRIHVSISEALDIVADDSFALSAVVSRECQGLTGFDRQICQEEVRGAAQTMGMDAEVQTRQSLNGIRSVVDGMLAITERKTLVLVSAGFPSSVRGGALNVDAEVVAIARDAARANANVYVLHVDNAFLDAFSADNSRISSTLGQDSSMLATGLENIASASGGTLVRVVSTADAAFDRILKETAASYVLGLEPADTDRDGKPHAIRVNVKVSGAQVRARREFVLPRVDAAATPADPLTAALTARRLATALPIGVSTHAVGLDPSGGLRVLVTADIGKDLAGPTEFKVALAVTDAAGRVVFATKPAAQQLTAPPGSESRSASYLATIALRPGDYTLRLAAVDPSGRAGSVDHPFGVRLTTGEGITMGDLLLLRPSTSARDTLSAIADGRVRSAPVELHLEIFGKPTGATPGVTFGVADKPDGAMLIQVRGSVARRDAKGRYTADGVLDLALLPPGDYYAVAVVSDAKRRLGARHEAVRVEPPAAAAEAVAAGSAPRVRFFLGDSTGLVRRFTRAEVLTPQALAYFADRLQAADPSMPAEAARALTEVRSGRFDEVLAALKEVPADRLSVPFLRGLALLSAGELDPAANQMREAARIADDFLPAAFFLGACYAEGGRDDEAVGAWQTALVTESDARIVYDVLTDALLRLEDAEQAVDVLDEARGHWPTDEAFLPRLAVAQAMLGRRADALATLQAYLENHQSDTEATALAIRLIYEARAAGRPVTTDEADRAAASRYGEWYRANGGRNLPLVDRWLAFIAKK
jgi:VWFA-related protein